MRIITRYIFKELLSYMFMGLLVFTFVLFMNQILHFTDLFINKGLPFGTVFKMVLVISPSLFLVTIPMALLVSTVMTLSRMSADSENIALRATGVSFFRQLVPVCILSVMAYATSSYLVFYALPWSEKAFNELRFELANSSAATTSIKERVFMDDFDGLILYVNEKPSTEEVMKGVLIYDSRSKEAPQTIIAEEGVFISNPESMKASLRLRNGSIHKAAQDEKKYQMIRFTTYEVNLDTRSLLGAAGRLERAGKNHSLYVIREKLKRYGPKHRLYNELLVEYYKKFSLPMACLIIGLVGAPLGIQNRRSGKSGGLALSLAVITLYYVLLSLGEGLGDGGQIPPVIAMWMPNVVLGAIGLYLITKVQRDSPFRLVAQVGERIRGVGKALWQKLFLQGLETPEGEGA
ncbi:MAG: LPS export ABC transporter permease LptF [Nitrospinota bacterium]